MATIKTLKDYQGNDVYPITSTEAVVDPSGNTLEERIAEVALSAITDNCTFVDYGNNQDLTDNEQKRARVNIDAASDESLTKLMFSTIGFFVCDTPPQSVVKTIPEEVGGVPVKISQYAEFKVKFTNVNTSVDPYFQIGNDESTKRPLYWNGFHATSENTWTAGEIADVWFDGSIYWAKPHMVTAKGDEGDTPDNVAYIDCGWWIDGNTYPTPTIGRGIYLAKEYNPNTKQWETHDVWHTGAKWRCLTHQPIHNSTTGRDYYYEPRWNSPYWKLLEGDDYYGMEFSSSHGYVFRYKHVYTVVTPYVYCGFVDISEDIPIANWSWTRAMLIDGVIIDVGNEAWNAAHKETRVLTITNDDIPLDWTPSKQAVFTCKAIIDDGKSIVVFENKVIV